MGLVTTDKRGAIRYLDGFIERSAMEGKVAANPRGVQMVRRFAPSVGRSRSPDQGPRRLLMVSFSSVMPQASPPHSSKAAHILLSGLGVEPSRFLPLPSRTGTSRLSV